ncbi:MAG: hypothetical protein HY904_21495 [Deltaproteobacteria bacterium]|nr:hypothetical protein [Deltaproteobacteria bacterium]
MRHNLPTFLLAAATAAAAVFPLDAAAAPRNATPLFTKGHGPQRPMELLSDVALEVSPALGRTGALEALRKQALEMGADAVIDVVVQPVKVTFPVGMITGLPMVVMGGLLSLATLSPDPVAKVAQQELQQGLTREVLLVRGVPVKFLR